MVTVKCVGKCVKQVSVIIEWVEGGLHKELFMVQFDAEDMQSEDFLPINRALDAWKKINGLGMWSVVSVKIL